MTTPLTLTHLRFDCVALTPVKLARHYAGNNLRNALASVMLRATCSETNRRAKPTSEHAAACPACWLLSAEINPGSVVRAYALVPPLPLRDVVQPGECFSFALTLFGDGSHFFPYFVLAMNEVGRLGVGPGRGTFALEEIYAIDPVRERQEPVLAAGDSLVRVPHVQVDSTAALALAGDWLFGLAPDNELTIRFHTPLRLVEKHGGKERPYRTPDFSVFFRRLLYRIDDLTRQFAGGERRAMIERVPLYRLADQVRLVESRTHWHEFWSRSGRKNSKTPLSGLVGTATYWAADWTALLPWLLLGQATQAGKSTAKGNGVYELVRPGETGYWHWLTHPADLSQI
ncbi:MAG: CRISPR system precrRNA processing endoribonuclease RAMP protein Cas6 [Anaerolineae bacterium]